MTYYTLIQKEKKEKEKEEEDIHRINELLLNVFWTHQAYSNETRSLIQYKTNNLLMAISAFAKYTEIFVYLYT